MPRHGSRTTVVSFADDDASQVHCIGYSAYTYLAQYASKHHQHGSAQEMLWYSMADLESLLHHEIQRMYKNKGNKHSWRGLEHVQAKVELHASSSKFVKSVRQWMQAQENASEADPAEALRRHCRSQSHHHRKVAALRGTADQEAAGLIHSAAQSETASANESVLQRSFRREQFQRSQSLKVMSTAMRQSFKQLNGSVSDLSAGGSQHSTATSSSSKNKNKPKLPERSHTYHGPDTRTSKKKEDILDDKQDGEENAAKNNSQEKQKKPSAVRLPPRSRTFQNGETIGGSPSETTKKSITTPRRSNSHQEDPKMMTPGPTKQRSFRLQKQQHQRQHQRQQHHQQDRTLSPPRDALSPDQTCVAQG